MRAAVGARAPRARARVRVEHRAARSAAHGLMAGPALPFAAVFGRVKALQESGGRGLPPLSTALAELRAGRKSSCWIWYALPSLRGVRKTTKPELELPDFQARDEWRSVSRALTASAERPPLAPLPAVLRSICMRNKHSLTQARARHRLRALCCATRS